MADDMHYLRQAYTELLGQHTNLRRAARDLLDWINESDGNVADGLARVLALEEELHKCQDQQHDFESKSASWMLLRPLPFDSQTEHSSEI